jgi:hypothetical protein
VTALALDNLEFAVALRPPGRSPIVVRSAVVSTSVALTRDPLADELPGGGQKGRLLAVSQGLGVRFSAVESCLEQFGEALCEGERD